MVHVEQEYIVRHMNIGFLVVVVAGAFCGYHFMKKNNVQQSKLKKEQLEKNVKKQVNQLTDVENFINKSISL